MHIAAQQGLHAALGVAALLGGAALLGAAECFLNLLKRFLQKALCQRASELSSFREAAKVAGRTASGNGNADVNGNGNADANESAAEAKQKPRRGHPQQGLLSFVLLLYD